MLSFLAMDYGASNGRAVIGDYDGSTLKLDCVHRFPNEPVTVAGRMYWDILRLFLEVQNGIAKAVQCRSEIASVGIDTWGAGFGLLGRTGELLENPYHYRDHCMDGVLDRICAIVPQREIYEQTGALFSMHTSLFQLFAMKSDLDSLLDKSATLLPIPDLFNYFLTGEKLTEHTIASSSQMYSMKHRHWASRMLDDLGLPTELLTEFVNPGTAIGGMKRDVCEAIGIDSIPVIAVASHDTASAIMAMPVTGRGSAFISCGTWSIMGIELEQPIINNDTYRRNFGNESMFGHRVSLVKNIPALWMLQQCKKEWDGVSRQFSYGELELCAVGAAPFRSIIDVDDDALRGPGRMTQKIISLCVRLGQPVPESKGEIVRCILESIAVKYRMVLGELEAIAGHSIDVITLCGGGANSHLLCQFAADATNRTVVTGQTEAAAAGNILCQLIAKGELADMSEAKQLVDSSFTNTVYHPHNYAPL